MNTWAGVRDGRRSARGTERNRNRGDLFHDFRNSAAGKGASLGEKEPFASGQVRVPHGLAPEAARYVGPRACRDIQGTESPPRRREPSSPNRKILPVKITEKEPTGWKFSQASIHTHKMKRELSHQGRDVRKDED